MKFDDIVGNILNEAPMDHVDQIRSTRFTTDIPRKAKFELGDGVQLTGPAAEKFGAGIKGIIVGMQRNTGKTIWSNRQQKMVPMMHAINRYYVKLPRMEGQKNRIVPISSMYLMRVD